MKSIIQLIKDWIKSIQESDNQQYIDKIKELEEELKEETEISEKRKQQILDLLKEEKELKQKIEELTKIIEDSKKEEREINRPSWLKKGVLYNPKRRIVAKDYDKVIEFKNPSEVFDKSVMLYNLLQERGFFKLEKNYKTVRKLLSFFNKYIKYHHDKTENWRPPTDTLMSKIGDCEDYAILITSALGMLGWKEDEVFLAMGEFHPNPKDDKKFFGHAWSVVKINKEWWVLEGTNPNSYPERWKNVKGNYRASWGLINWKYNGHLQVKEGKYYYLEEE